MPVPTLCFLLQLSERKTIAIEPIPRTFSALVRNIQVNQCEALIKPLNKGVGEQEGALSFTQDYDTINHVSIGSNENLLSIEVTTLDKIFANKKPLLLKMDVEGYELFALKGAVDILKSNELKAIIIEINGSGERYGYSDTDVHDLLSENNYEAYSYLPFKRKLERKTTSHQGGNTLYLKDVSFVKTRVETANKVKVLGKVF